MAIYFQNKDKTGRKLHENVEKYLVTEKHRKTGFIVDAPSHERTHTVRTQANIQVLTESVHEYTSTLTHHRSQELNIERISLHGILRKDLGMTRYKTQLL